MSNMTNKSFTPHGGEVESHLRTYGHLPGDTNCCARESIDQAVEGERERIREEFEKAFENVDIRGDDINLVYNKIHSFFLISKYK